MGRIDKKKVYLFLLKPHQKYSKTACNLWYIELGILVAKYKTDLRTYSIEIYTTKKEAVDRILELADEGYSTVIESILYQSNFSRIDNERIRNRFKSIAEKWKNKRLPV